MKQANTDTTSIFGWIISLAAHVVGLYVIIGFYVIKVSCSPLWWQKHLVSNEVNRTLLKIVFFSFPSGCCWSCWYIPYTLGLSASSSLFFFHFPVPSCLNVDGFWEALCVPYLWFCGVLLYRLVMSKGLDSWFFFTLKCFLFLFPFLNLTVFFLWHQHGILYWMHDAINTLRMKRIRSLLTAIIRCWALLKEMGLCLIKYKRTQCSCQCLFIWGTNETHMRFKSLCPINVWSLGFQD